MATVTQHLDALEKLDELDPQSHGIWTIDRYDGRFTAITQFNSVQIAVEHERNARDVATFMAIVDAGLAALEPLADPEAVTA